MLLYSVSFIYAQPQSHTFTINNETRQYYLYTPDSLGQGVPLLFVLHGYSGSAVSIMNYSMDQKFRMAKIEIDEDLKSPPISFASFCFTIGGSCKRCSPRVWSKSQPTIDF